MSIHSVIKKTQIQGPTQSYTSYYPRTPQNRPNLGIPAPPQIQ